MFQLLRRVNLVRIHFLGIALPADLWKVVYSAPALRLPAPISDSRASDSRLKLSALPAARDAGQDPLANIGALVGASTSEVET